MKHWQVIVCQSDCTSVQILHAVADTDEEAARKVFADVAWVGGYELIAVVHGLSAAVSIRDDNRTAERGLLQ